MNKKYIHFDDFTNTCNLSAKPCLKRTQFP